MIQQILSQEPEIKVSDLSTRNLAWLLTKRGALVDNQDALLQTVRIEKPAVTYAIPENEFL